MFFYVSCQFNANSGTINQVTLGDQPIDEIDLVATLVCFSGTFLLLRILNILPEVVNANLCLVFKTY